MNNNEKNNQNKQNNQNINQGKPVSAHPDPVTPNQSNGITAEKNKIAPVSGHPDPVVPNVEEKVEHDKHQHDKDHDDHQPAPHDLPKPGGHTPGGPVPPHAPQSPAGHGKEEHMNGDLTYEDKVIQKIIGIALEQVDGLLSVDGGFFSNVAGKLVNTDNTTAGIDTEVGKKQVAVDLSIIVEYGKDIEKIFQQIKEIISKEVQNMTHLDVIEINANVTDIQSKEEFDAKQETVQDKVTNAAKTTGQFASDQTDKAKQAIDKGMENVKENTDSRVQ
ncbi:Asp23/Gls24 family envelope stress response protein [Enterococcus durans]|uniref:Asp23/Gls24 family envelope stress response protein n=1 Tax=Enterococcus durans TaxID=53345 RepID=UPI00289183FE|nr:Asp23/Gls24 family envelope stress response protein [Enterococcus durans]MDT2837334.1 Asp23/Gls24 family envelope stress response protein [Enterococcus durans]